MTKWEYKVLYENFTEIGKEGEFLNTMGKDGWDNYSIYFVPDSTTCFYYFKRPIPEEAKSLEEKIKDQFGDIDLFKPS